MAGAPPGRGVRGAVPTALGAGPNAAASVALA